MSALRGIRVLELAESVSGEYCGKLLADFGAEVIKLEQPGTGSPTRRLEPLAATDGPAGERSGLFAYLNTNKQSVAVDLGSDGGRALLKSLLAQVAVVVDDHGPDWLAAIGLDPATLEQQWPALVLCVVTPFGFDAPAERRHADDLTVFHASGWGYHTPSGANPERPPLKGAGRFLPSYEAGLDAALCVAAALYERETSGQGQLIEISQQAVLTSRVDYVVGQMVAGDMDVGASRHQFDLGGPAGIFPCRDGFAYLWMSAPGHWEGLRQLLGDPAWMGEFPERWLELECTPERVAQCRQHIAAWLQNEAKHDVAAAAQKLGLTLVAINGPRDLMASPQFEWREFFAPATHPVLGKVRYPTVPYRLSETPTQIRSAAPLLGEHSTAWQAGMNEGVGQ